MAKYDEKIKAEAVEMVKQGIPLTEIKKKLGPNPKAVQRYCKKAGVEIPKKEKKPKAEKKPKDQAPAKK